MTEELAPIDDDVSMLIEALRLRYTQPEAAPNSDNIRLQALQIEQLEKLPDTIELDACDREALRLALEGRDVMLVKKDNPGVACATAFLACVENAIYIDCATWPNMPRSSGAETRLFVYDFGAEPTAERKKLIQFISRKKEQGMIIFVSASQAGLHNALFGDIDAAKIFLEAFDAVAEAPTASETERDEK